MDRAVRFIETYGSAEWYLDSEARDFGLDIVADSVRTAVAIISCDGAFGAFP